jgi:hypothetical protein
MPCNSDHMEANPREVALSRVMCVLQELKTGKPINPDSSDWDGYHKSVYCKSINDVAAHSLTADLCAKLKKLPQAKLKRMSLEAQTWWRDHQLADKRRAAEARDKKVRERQRKSALSKLTKKEREALGV